MKRIYERPMARQTIFQTSEYIAACYKIKCTTPNNNGRFKYLYEDTNKNGVYDKGDRLVYSSWGTFTGCNNWHKGVIKAEAPSVNGFVKNGGNNSRAYSVYYWKEHLSNDSVDYHVMTPGRENYETNPNAS